MARAGAHPLPQPPGVSLPRAQVHRWRLALVLSALLVAHVVGWRITRIDLAALVIGLPNMRHIVAGLVQPDAFERLRDEVSADSQLTLLPARPVDAAGPEAGGLPEVPSAAREVTSTSGQRLIVEPAQAAAGQIVNVRGSGWPAGKPGQVLITDAIGRPQSAGAFTVAPDGTINHAFYIPAWAEGNYPLRVEVVTPRFGWRPTDTLRLNLRLMVETLFLALMGTSLAVLLTLPLSFLGARNLMAGSRSGRSVYYAVRIIFNLLRSIEVVIVVTIMAVVVGIGSFAGVLAIVVHSIGALGKLYSEAIEAIDPGPIEAIAATGARPLQVVRYAVVPQVVPQFLAFTLYRMDVNVRMSTIVGLVGGGGIGFILTQYINLLQWNQAGTAIWLIAIVVTSIDYLSAWLRERII